MAASSSIMTIKGPQDYAIFAPVAQDTFWMSGIVTYSNFSYNIVKINPDGANVLSDKNKYYLHGYGDLISSLYELWQGPALLPNPGGLENAAHQDLPYYINSCPLHGVTKSVIRVGQQEVETMHGRYEDFLIETSYPPGERWEEALGTFSSTEDLRTFSRSDVTFIRPILLPQTRWLHCAKPACAIQGSQLYLEVSHRKISELVYNYDKATGIYTNLPYVYGTSTPISNSDIEVNCLATNIFLDDCERALFSCADLQYVIRQTQEVEISISSIGRVIPSAVVLNHPVTHLILMIQRNAAISGNPTDGDQHGKRIGDKDIGDYSADHGGESIANWDLKVNANSIFDTTILPSMYLRVIRPHECLKYTSKRNIYLWNFGPYCTEFNPTQTLNFSQIEKFTMSFDNNNSAWTTGDKGFLYADNINQFACFRGIAGVPYNA